MKSFVFSVLMQARAKKEPITVFMKNGFQMRGTVQYVTSEAFWLESVMAAHENSLQKAGEYQLNWADSGRKKQCLVFISNISTIEATLDVMNSARNYVESDR